ncbi:DUF6308 family protein [Rhodococcus sp. USK13]|uniref:DUF6308 family protein n=1 Tax=Rhodococcus sp. USK13 TaxID=2806442 RepID=UPI00201667B1|nr:DUF6308 family protein [Rhodococcus sp. USK13]
MDEGNEADRPQTLPAVPDLGFGRQQVLGTERSHLNPVREALRADDAAVHHRLLSIREEAGLPEEISALRVFDVIAWMDGKNRGDVVMPDWSRRSCVVAREEVGRRLRITTSDLERAAETARILADALGAEVRADARLRRSVSGRLRGDRTPGCPVGRFRHRMTIGSITGDRPRARRPRPQTESSAPVRSAWLAG